jgi:hypothetical protein
MNRRPKQISGPIETGQDSGRGHAVKNLLKVEKTRQYVRDFDRATETTSTTHELYDQMLKLRPNRMNPTAFWASARDEAVTDTGENTPGKLEGKDRVWERRGIYGPDSCGLAVKGTHGATCYH